jgi:hypothetical protein
MKKLLYLICLLMLAIPTFAQEEEAEEEAPALPPIPYFVAENTSRKFNMPVPFDWENVSSDPNIAHFTHPNGLGEIYGLPVDPQDPQVAAETAIKRILGDISLTARYSGQFQLDGNDWGKFAFTSELGTVTAFTQTRYEAVYVLFYHYPKTDHEFYFMAQNVIDEDVPQTTVLSALSTLYPDIPESPQAESIVTLSNGDWTRQVYAVGDAELVTLWQKRGAVVYITVENGDGAVVDSVNKALFTSLFGFFITPRNTEYMVLGLVVTFGIAGIFVLSLFLRHRGLSRDEALVRELVKS